MRITQFKATNFMRLEAVEINPIDNTVLITGPNGAGKSSVLKALVTLFCPKYNWPDMPIRQGQDTAVIEASTEEFTAKLTIRKNGTSTLEVRPLDGKSKYTAPQQFFDEIRDKFAFNPLKYATEEPKKQRSILIDLVGLNVDDLQAEYATCQRERAEINSNKSLMQRQLDGIIVPDGTPDAEVSITELSGKIQEAEQFNARLDNAYIQIEQKDRERNNHRKKAEELEEEIRKIYVQLNTKINTLKNTQELKAECECELSKQRAAVEGVGKKDTTEIAIAITAAEATNRSVHLKQNKAELQRAIDKKSNEYVEFGRQMKELEAQKAKRLSEIKMPVAGLSVSEDCVLFDDIPLSQTNTAKALEVCIAISMAMNPKLRVMWGNANDLDDASLEVIKKIAEENDYQLWLEKWDGRGQAGFCIEEGRIADASI